MDIQGGKADDKLNDTSAAAQAEMLTGCEGCWVMARRNNWCYYLNKFVSFGIATFFGLITLYLKLMAMKLIKAQDDAADANESNHNKIVVFHLQNMFWLMFIYQMMQAMDELSEFFSSAFELEKGALGLFFEVNKFVGIGLTFYMGYFILGVKKATFGKAPK